MREPAPPSPSDPARGGGGERAGTAAPRPAECSPLHWARKVADDDAMAAADWLAADIAPRASGAVVLLTARDTTLDELRQAKDAFKAMRILGESAADRRLGARLYLAAIAAALAYHNTRISSQSDSDLAEALCSLRDDASQHEALRRLARAALRALGIDPSRSGA